MFTYFSTRHVLLAGALALSATPALAVDEDEDFVGEGWVEGRLAAMTLKEKIGQMLMVDLLGTQFDAYTKEQMERGEFGSVLLLGRNIQEEDQTRLLIRQLQTHAVVRTGVPLLVAVDQEGGAVNRVGPLTNMKTTRFSARTIGRVYEYAPKRAGKLMATLTGELARRMKWLGFNMNLAPVLDVTDDKHSFIYDRSFGGDPDLVTRASARFASVMQANGIIATGKHFPNLSTTKPDSHHELPILDRRLADLEKKEFVPFKKIKDDLGAIMVGHVVVPDLDPMHPASVSPKAIQALRQRIGWRGVIISDDIKMKALSARYPLPEIVIRSVHAGVDLLIVAWGRDKQEQAARVLETAVAKGHLSKARIDESVRRILTLKYQYAER
jgi:beta-N-acetylhexosaminidase